MSSVLTKFFKKPSGKGKQTNNCTYKKNVKVVFTRVYGFLNANLLENIAKKWIDALLKVSFGE